MNDELLRKAKHTLMCSAASATLIVGLATASVQAQEAAAQDAESDVEEIVVTGIRGAMMRARELKRNADQGMDAISSEDIGKLPDNNMAEALQRIAGVSIQREFGEGGQVSVRGMGASLNNVTVNGKLLASSQQGREFNFSSIGSELVSGLEVYKSPLASQDEGSLGGTVNLVVKGALERKDGQISASVSGGYDELSGKTSPRASLSINKHLTDKIGINIGVNYFDRTSRSDIYGATGGWKPYNLATKMLNPNGSGKYIAAKDNDGNKLAKGEILLPDGTVVANPLIPQQVQYQLRNGTRERIGGNLGLHFRPTDELDIKLTGIYSRLEHTDDAGAHQARLDQNFVWDNAVYDSELNAILSADTSPHAATKRGLRHTWTERLMEEETSGIDFEAKYDNETSEFVVAAGASKAHKDDNRTGFGGQETSPLSYDFVVDDPYFPALDLNPLGYTDYTVRSLSYNDFKYEDESSYLQADYTYRPEENFFKALSVGVKLAERTKANSRTTSSVPGNQRAGLMMSDYSAAYPVEDFLSIVPDYLDPTFDGVDFDAIKADYPHGDYEAVPRSGEMWSVKEVSQAAYVQADFEMGKLRGNVGVRYVQTDVHSEGIQEVDGVLSNRFVNNSYDDWLPSLNMVYAITEEILLRTSVAKVMARPSFKDMNAGAKINEGPDSANYGNPELDPYRADQFDIGLEWYYGENGMVAVSYFYKDIKTFVYKEPFADQVIPGFETDENGDDQFFTITRPTNGTGGSFQGFEFSWQQDVPFIPGFGFAANYTYSDSSTELVGANGDLLPMEGVSKHSGNIVTYYEKGPLGLRLTWNYRDDFMAKSFTLSGSPQFTGGSQYLDASIRYNINDNLTLTLEGKNLTKEIRRQFVGDERLTFALRNDTGRVFTLGMRAKF